MYPPLAFPAAYPARASLCYLQALTRLVFACSLPPLHHFVTLSG